jgi:hypothetical protein
MRKERKLARQNALEVYRQRCIRLSLTGFTLAAQHMTAIQESGSDDELVSSSGILFEESLPAKISKPVVESKRLAAPKRPNFLGPGRPRITSPNRPAKSIELDPETVFATLETRYLELKTRLEQEDGEQKQQTLTELNQLMQEIGTIASEIE